MNNRIKKVLLKIVVGAVILFFLSLVGGYYYISWLSKQPCPPPEKPKNVPEKAIWKGACDGGHWIELVKINGNKYRFRIYLGWNGELLLDADYYLKNCKNVSLSFSNWNEFISWFSGENLEIKKISEKKDWKCRLVPNYPAYGGSQWDVTREKGGVILQIPRNEE